MTYCRLTVVKLKVDGTMKSFLCFGKYQAEALIKTMRMDVRYMNDQMILDAKNMKEDLTTLKGVVNVYTKMIKNIASCFFEVSATVLEVRKLKGYSINNNLEIRGDLSERWVQPQEESTRDQRLPAGYQAVRGSRRCLAQGQLQVVQGYTKDGS